MSEKLKEAFGLSQPRVISKEELQSEYNHLAKLLDEHIAERKQLNKDINAKKKRMSELLKLIEYNSQYNMFPDL
jgi:hypothetical protein